MRRSIYKKIFFILSIVAVVILLTFYFVGLKTQRNIVLKQDFENPAIKNNEVNNFSPKSSVPNNLEKKEISDNKESLIKVFLKINDNTYSKEIKEGSTAYELMSQLKSDTFNFTGKEYSGIGFFVSEINGLSEDRKNGYYWTLYINDKESNAGVSDLILRDGDVVMWKYENRD